MNIKNIILTKIKEHNYSKYIKEHKENIDRAFYEMVMCPDMEWIGWDDELCYQLKQRVDKHDDSKYSEEEFDAYRKFYHPISQEEKENAKKDFDKAWEHHWQTNDHHWQNRQNDNAETMTIEQQLACLENVLDWMAMGYKFNDRPYKYYERNKDTIIMPKIQKDFIEKVIYEGIDKQYIRR